MVKKHKQQTLAQFPELIWNLRQEQEDGPTFYCRAGKRAFDFAGAFVGLLALMPLLLACMAVVKILSPGPVFFWQCRVGKGGKPFTIIKFRTMRHEPGNDGLSITADGDSRVTPIGRWLRKLKFDELPQLFNVLAGDMSLVGPRAEVAKYVALYTDGQMRVLETRPGLTGAASVAYIGEEMLLGGQPDKEAFYVNMLMPQKLQLELAYCQKITFVNDLRLILATLRKLLCSHLPPVKRRSASEKSVVLGK